jgi:hypothetical protein
MDRKTKDEVGSYEPPQVVERTTIDEPLVAVAGSNITPV